MAKLPTAVCIPQNLVDKIKKIDLTNLSSLERKAELQKILGDKTGFEISNIYEKKLLLKNQKNVFDKFIDSIDGTSVKVKEKMRESMLKRMAEKQDIIKDEELLSIVKETLDKKYDLDISDDKIKEMFKLRKEADELAKKAKGTVDGSTEKLAWGEKIVELSDLVGNEKEVAKNLLAEIKLGGKRIAEKYNEKEYTAMVGQIIRELGGVVFSPVTKSVKASLDNSVLFRQGLKVLSASRGTFYKNQAKTWKMWGKVLNKAEMEKMAKAFKADLVTRDLYQDAIKSKLAIGVVEDFFPTSIVQKIPGLGNFFKASDEAFTMFSQGSRMDLFEKYVNIYKSANNGAMPGADDMKLFAKIANSTTGRGGLGKLEAFSGELNKILFSARFQTANINTFRHAFVMTGTAGKIARQQLGRHLLMVGGTLATLSMFMDVGLNPKENTFGKVRIPGTKKWVDVTGGLGSYFALMGRGWDKYQNPGYKDTVINVALDFALGKLAPTPGAVRDILAQRDYSGKKPTPLSITRSIFMPISIDNPIKDYEKDIDAKVNAFSTFLEAMGTSVSSPSSKSEGSYKSALDIITGK